MVKKEQRKMSLKRIIATALVAVMVMSATVPAMAAEDKTAEMSETQKNSLNMLNFLTVLTQQVNASKGSRLYAENAYSSLLNNIYPNAVDARTQAQITNIFDTLEKYRMVDVKRKRLEYIYEQNRAQAMKQAIPSPMSVLNVVQSKNWLKAAVSVIYMAVDSYTSYSTYAAQTDLEYLQDGWELDDEEAAELHNSRKQAFTYMMSMVRDNDLPGDYALNEDSVEEFVSWKNNTNVVRRIAFLEANKDTYQAFGTYWLTLAESYYENGDYKKCLDSVAEYEKISSRIFRKDYDYAKILPMAIVAAKEVYGDKEYRKYADKYAPLIIRNSDNKDWTMTYFVAQIYLDLYVQTGNKEYAQKAYKIASDNANYLTNEQKKLNEEYLADVVEEEAPKGATKRKKEEIKQYNKMLKAERKIALPPVNGALYLNCDLLFALAEELGLEEDEKNRVDSILHGNGEPLFLMKGIDDQFWFEKQKAIDPNNIEISFDGEKFVIPATYVSSNSKIKVSVKDNDGLTFFDDWTIDEVSRKKKDSYAEFTATFKSKNAGEFKYKDGMIVTITVTPVEEDSEETIEFTYKVKGVKKVFVFDGVEFERVKK